MASHYNNILLVFFLVFFDLKTNHCSEDGDNTDDLDTLNFNIFQMATGEGDCPPLIDPKNGRFECLETRDLGISRRVAANITCTLVCNKGYTLPLIQNTATGKSVLLENTGVYKCLSNTDSVFNRRQWDPLQFFDCTPIRKPIECQLYFSLTLTQKEGNCDPDDDVHFAQTLSAIDYDTTTICNNVTGNCTWDAGARCQKNTPDWKVVLILSWPFNADFVEQRDTFPDHFKEDIGKIKVGDETNAANKIDAEAFQVVCPKGTHFSNDLLCHGCYKGNFLNETTWLCQSCPLRYFQDKDLQVSCQMCPDGSKGYLKGGTHITSCFKMHELLHETDLLTMTYCLSTVITFVFALIIFNNQVHKEADEDNKKKQVGHVEFKPEDKQKERSKAQASVVFLVSETIQSDQKDARHSPHPRGFRRSSLRSGPFTTSVISGRFRSMTSSLFGGSTGHETSEYSSSYSDSV